MAVHEQFKLLLPVLRRDQEGFEVLGGCTLNRAQKGSALADVVLRKWLGNAANLASIGADDGYQQIVDFHLAACAASIVLGWVYPLLHPEVRPR